ncbi:MAG: hypothetical protein AAGN82_07200 [Myxococcota bacterium]
MKLAGAQVLMIVVGTLAYAFFVYFVDRWLSEGADDRFDARAREALAARDRTSRLALTLVGVGAAGYVGFRAWGAAEATSINPFDHRSSGLAIAAVLAATTAAVQLKATRPRLALGVYRFAMGLGTVGLFFWFLGEGQPNYKKAVSISKAAIAIAAAACVFFEAHRKGQGRPIAERWKKLIGITLALMAISAYFNGYRFGYPKYWHRWDQYHYYIGAKYFPELSYKNLYKCAVVAQHEVGRLPYKLDRPWGSDKHATRNVDMGKEMQEPDKKIRDLLGDNLLIPVGDILDHPEACRDRFTPERWEQYKRDIAFFRIVSGKGYWTDMQKDHGFNPPPVWTIGGKFFGDLAQTSSVRFHQFLASLDIVYLVGMFLALWWGFGWRVFAVGAVFWGCQSSAPFYWTGGAFLRQDWLFFSVLSVACIRRRYFKTAGAALVYAGLLRIFPGLVVVGTLVPTIAYAVRHRRMHRDHLQMLIGGTLAAAVLLPLSIYMSGVPEGKPFYHPYKVFYEHTIETHDRTPLTNHMGLRVIVGHKFVEFQAPGIRPPEERETWKAGLSPTVRRFLGWAAPLQLPVKVAQGPSSGQMQYVRDNRLLDPFETWKRMRNERYEQYKGVAYAIVLGTLAFFILVVRRVKSLWVAQCLGQIFIILGSQLTCYYYSFMILAAPLTRLRRPLELGLFALAAITQIIWMNSYWNDNKYTLLTIVSLLFCYGMVASFARGRAWRRWLADKTGIERLRPAEDAP